MSPTNDPPHDTGEGEKPPPPILSYRSAHSAPEEWVTIFKARTPPEANLAVAALREKGLSVRVDSENTATLGAWAGAGPGTDTGVQVLAGDVEAARAFLDEIERRRQARREALQLKCPRCRRPDPKRILPMGRVIELAMIALGLALAWLDVSFVLLSVAGAILLAWPAKPRWRCRACGHTWRADEPKELDDDDNTGDDDGDDENGDDEEALGAGEENDAAPVDRNGGGEQREH